MRRGSTRGRLDRLAVRMMHGLLCNPSVVNATLLEDPTRLNDLARTCIDVALAIMSASRDLDGNVPGVVRTRHRLKHRRLSRLRTAPYR